MPTDPRMVAAPSSPTAAPASQSQFNGVFVALVDLSRRISTLEASRTVIKADTITSTHIAAGAITASEIQVGNVVASIMTVGAVNASHIDANSIRTSVLNATNIIAQGLQTQVLTAVQGAITDLSSISNNTGTLTASLIKTGNSPNARIEIGTTAGGIKGYNSSNALTFGFDYTTGAATVGSITVTGAGGTAVPSSTLTGFIGGGNLLTDSSFESADPATPASLWPTLNGVSITKSTTHAFHGTTALRVAWSSGTDSYVTTDAVAQHGVPVTALQSRPVVVSAWVWVDTTATTLGAGLDRSLVLYDGTTITSATISTLAKGQWNRVVIKATVSAAASAVNIRLYNPYTNGPVWYDGVQLELGDAATAYAPKPDEILYGSITSTLIKAGEVKATNIDTGAITADKISLGVSAAASVRNGNFNEGNPTTGSTLANGWTLQVGNAATVQTDTAWPRIARIVNATNIGSAMTQDVNLPLGRSILRLWAKTTGVANSVPGTSGATLSAVAGTGTGTIGAVTRIVGTTGWTLIERDVTVTATGTFAVRIRLDDAGTADFANFHVIPATTGTTLTPTSIDAMTITGATFQTAAAGGARVVMDSAGLRFIDSTLATTVDLSSTAGGLTILATATDTPPASRKMRLLHTAGGATAGEFFAFSNNTATPTFANGTFDVDLSSWTTQLSSGTATRDTATTQSGAGSLNMTIPSVLTGPDHIYTTITGTFKAGLLYRIPFYARGASRIGTATNEYVKLWTSTARTTLIQQQYVNMVSGSWTRNVIEYRPTADTTNPVLEFSHSTSGSDTIYFDSVGPIEVPSSTVISSIAKTGGLDVGQIVLNVYDPSSVKTSALLLSSEGRSDFVRAYQTSPQIMTRVAWTASAGWATYANNYIWKDQLGYVHIIGEVQNTSGSTKAAGALIFPLPSPDYYPTYRYYFPCSAADGNIKIVQVASTGNVTVGDNGPTVLSTPSTGAVVNLGHIIYPTADAVL